jgi:hypothetical protein
MSSELGDLIVTTGKTGGKVELDPAREARDGGGTGKTAVIVKVSRDDYVPAGVDVRARISPQIFTADVDVDDIVRLEEDADVVSLGMPEAVGPIED